MSPTPGTWARPAGDADRHPGRHGGPADQGRAQPAGPGRDAGRPHPVCRRLWVRGRARRVTPIDIAAGKPRRLILAANSAAALAVTPDGRTLYVASRAGMVTPVDVATGQPGRPISVPEPSALAVTPDGRTLFAITSRNTVTPISIPGGKPGPPIKVGPIPTALAVTPDGRTLYVADNNDQNVLPIDIATRIPGRPIPVGRYLMALAVTPDGRTLYTADGDDNMVAVLHPAISKPTPQSRPPGITAPGGARPDRPASNALPTGSADASRALRRNPTTQLCPGRPERCLAPPSVRGWVDCAA